MACRRWIGSTVIPADGRRTIPNVIQCLQTSKSVIHKRLQHSQGVNQNAKFGFLFDIDGVIVRGKKLLPSAKEAFSILTDKNGEFRVPCLFVTNAGNTLRQNKAKQLSDWLDVHVHEDQVVMSHSPLKMFRQFHDKHVVVSGQGPIHEIAHGLGFTHITDIPTLRHTFTNLDMVDHKRRKAAPCAFEEYFPKIDAVILFGEPVRWETNLQLIIDVLLTNGRPGTTQKETPYPHLPVLACNMDLLWMAEAPNPRFGHGCFLNALESLYLKITGRELKYTALIGKPSEITYHHADFLLCQQARLLGIDGIKTIYCIGDNPETDIYGANLYNRYLLKRLHSQQKRLSAKAVVKQAVAHASGEQVTDMDEEEDAEDSSEMDMLDNTAEGNDGLDNFAESCESILVCTGVFLPERDFVTYGGKRPSNHNHRDFVIDPELKQPMHLRRQARLRREYIYRKSIEERERTIQEKKQKIKQSLEENEAVPTDLRKDAVYLEKTLDWEGEGADGLTTHIDDEYRWAGVEDPKIMITSSRDPSSKLKQFAKEMKLLFPNSQRINRGNYEMKQLIQACQANDVTDLILVQEHRGVPDGFVVCHLPYGPTAYFTLSNVVMRHDIPDVGTMSEAYPHLIFNNFSSKLGRRVQNILKFLFPVPKEDSKRVVTFANDEDYISFRHHVYKYIDKELELKEVGPRFEMKLYQIILGTLENADTADVEWVYKPYMNTAKKRKFLSVE